MIETQRLILKPFEKQDEKKLRLLLEDPDVMRFSTHGVYAKDEEIEVQNICSVFLKDSLRWIGFCGIFQDGKNWEMGYRFLKENWGKGFATEAVSAYIRHLRETPDITIFCYIDPENKASLRIAEKCALPFLEETLFKGHPALKFLVS